MLIRGVIPAASKLCSNAGSLIGSQSARLGSSYDSHHFKEPTMDELPVPSGTWEENYRRNQRKYNAHLIFGVGFTIFSLIVAKQSGLIFLNYSPPARPADKQ